MNFRAANCPACGNDKRGKILVCETCWWKVPAPLRIKFKQHWTRTGGKESACESMGAKILRKLGATPEAIDPAPVFIALPPPQASGLPVALP